MTLFSQQHDSDYSRNLSFIGKVLFVANLKGL